MLLPRRCRAMISTVSAVGWGSKFSNKIFPVKPHHSRRGARLQHAVQRKEATGSSAVHGVSKIGRNGQSEGVLEYSAIAIFGCRLKHLTSHGVNTTKKEFEKYYRTLELIERRNIMEDREKILG